MFCVFSRLKSAWLVRAYQKLLRVLNHRDTWKMQTKMQLHQHDSVAPGRHIYTLEHINNDFSGNKCGRCIRCFNPFRKAGCQNMNKQYSQGLFVYEFAEDPDVAYSGEPDATIPKDSLLCQSPQSVCLLRQHCMHLTST